MTTTTQIITDAFRQSNLIAIGVSPTALQQEEALRYLNRLVKSVFGNEAGDPLTSLPIGRNGIQRPSGYPWWDTVPDNNWFVPSNTRVMLNLTGEISLWLTPVPNDGDRFGALDSSKNVGTYNVTIHGNGSNIEGSQSVLLNTNGVDQTWFFRADLANWMKYAPLVLMDEFPFPEEFDDYFVSMLAMRLNPAYGTKMDEQSAVTLRRSKSQLQARYAQVTPIRSELGLIRMPKVAADRDLWSNEWQYYNPNAMFNKGWPI